MKVWLFCIGILISCGVLWGQSVEQDTARVLIHSITSLKSRNEQLRMVSDHRGGFYAVWKSARGDKNEFSIYGQRVDAAGNLRWATDGLLLTHSILHQNHPQISTDTSGNLILVWEQGNAPEIDIYAQKFDTNGKALWKKPLLLTPKDGPQSNPKILHNSKNQFFVFWEDDQKGFTGKDIYAQSFNAVGQILWDPFGVPVVKERNIQHRPQFAYDPGNEIVIVWEDFRSQKIWELYAQKLNIRGELLWDTAGVNILNNLIYNQRNFSIVGDGYGGFIASFEASGLTTAQNDIHSIRINTIGNKVFESVQANHYESQINPIMLKKGSNAYIFWEDYNQANADLIAQKINLFTGQKEWDSLGVTICDHPKHQTHLKAELLDFQGNILTLWMDERYGSSLYAQVISPEGKTLWENNGILITHTEDIVKEFQFIVNDDASAWIIYTVENYEGILPKFQKIKADGTLIYDLKGMPLHAYQSAITARLDELKMVKGNHQDLYFAWKDYRNGDLNPDIYLMRTDTNGNPLWQEGGVPICVADGEQSRPLIVPTDFGAIVAWVDRRLKNDENLFLQAIDTNGFILHAYNGIPICIAPRSQSDLRIIPNGHNQYLCLWTDARNLLTTGFDIYFQLLDSIGNPLLAKNGVPFQNTTAYENTPQLLCTSNNIYCIWMDDRSLFYNIYCQKLTPRGNPLWRQGGVPIQKGNFHQRYHLIEILQDGSIAVLWSDERIGQAYEKLFIQKLTPNAAPAWKLSGIEVSSMISRQVAPKMLADPFNGIIVTWLNSKDNLFADFSLYSARLSANAGNPFWDTKGIKISDGLLEDSQFAMCIVGDFIFYAWHFRASSGYEQIFWQAIHLFTGKPLLPTPQALGSPKRHQTHPNPLTLNENQLIIAWLEKNIYIVEDKILVKKIILKTS